MTGDVYPLMPLCPSACGPQDCEVFDDENPDMSIYDSYVTRISRSSFSYFTLKNDGAGDAAKDTVAFQLSGLDFDLIGGCHLSFTWNCEAPITHDIIDSCTFECCDPDDGQQQWMEIEKLGAKCFQAHATMNPNAFGLVHDDDEQGGGQRSTTVLIPIPFFFSHSTQHHFPLLRRQLFRVRCKFKALAAAEWEVDLVVKGIFLQTGDERRNTMIGKYSKMYCFSTIVAEETSTCGGCCKIALKSKPQLVKDLQVFVQGKQGEPTAVRKLCLTFNGHAYYRLPRLMSTRLIPRKYYNISHNPANIHYMPFCHDPNNHHDACSNLINFNATHLVSLYLREMPSSSYRVNVTVMARYHNTIEFDNGKCRFKYPAAATSAAAAAATVTTTPVVDDVNISGIPDAITQDDRPCT